MAAGEFYSAEGGNTNASKEGQGRLEGRQLFHREDPQEEIQDEEGGSEQGGDFEKAIQEGETYQEAVLMAKYSWAMAYGKTSKMSSDQGRSALKKLKKVTKK